jgi:hypothetical protein
MIMKMQRKHMLIGGVISLALLAGGGAIYARNHRAKPVAITPAPSPALAPQETPMPDPTPAPTPPPTPQGSTSITSKSTSMINGQTTIAPVAINLDAGDEGSDQNFTVSKGAVVTITFHVVGQVYDGGLVFDGSNGMNTGLVKTGESKSITYTASASVVYKPYWPDGTPKSYVIRVNAS